MKPTLRPYQTQMVREIYDRIGNGHSKIAIIAGTGAGKTVISGQVCADAVLQQHCRLLFLVHLDVLVRQTHKKLQGFGLHCGFIKAGFREDQNALVQIASIQTMAKRQWWRKWHADIVFYDEAHLTLFSQVGQDVLYKTHRDSIHLAMTATPERLGEDQLGEHLETFVASPPPAQLQSMGFLAQMRYYALPADGQAKLVDVETVNGDYDIKGLRNACDRPELVAKIVQEWRRLVAGKRTIAFCVDIEHAHHVAAAFRQSGIPAATVEGNTSIKDRQKLYADLREERILVLTSCDVISIGFDEPSVEVGLLLRPTQSSALHIQQIGRVMRISPQTGKEFGVILDQAGNLERLGFPEDITQYHLPMRKIKAMRSKGPTRKVCPNCDQLQPKFLMQCSCGHSWRKPKKVNTGDLVQVYSSVQAQQIDDPELLRQMFHQIRQRIFTAGYSLDVAHQQFFEYAGREPLPEWHRGSIVGDLPGQDAIAAFWHYLQRCASSQGFSQDWVRYEFELETGCVPPSHLVA